ncbi:unnamed protein product [marine sediment metagenome]|uniref:Uncharacterized protein n=1 Tax=marine sediment metagenome TaxID=412755 RepID=X1RH62_9ZZZZ
MKIKQLPRVNRNIRAQRVKLIDDKGQVLGEFQEEKQVRVICLLQNPKKEKGDSARRLNCQRVIKKEQKTILLN